MVSAKTALAVVAAVTVCLVPAESSLSAVVANDSGFLFTSTDGSFNAFWYTLPGATDIKIQYEATFKDALATTPAWAGFGVRQFRADGSMVRGDEWRSAFCSTGSRGCLGGRTVVCLER